MYHCAMMDVMIPEADMVMRHLVPVLLDASGESGQASELRLGEPIDSASGIGSAACRIKALRAGFTDSPWQDILDDLLFWAEAAIWAAGRGDTETYELSVVRIRDGLASALPVTH